MDNLSRRILAEKENVEKALANLDKAIKRKKKTTIELAAIGTFLHNIYSGIENILKQNDFKQARITGVINGSNILDTFHSSARHYFNDIHTEQKI